MGEEVFNRHLYEYAGCLDREDTLTRNVEAAPRLGEYSPTDLAGDPRVNVQRVCHRDRAAKVDGQTRGHGRHAEEPVQASEHLIKGGRQHPAVGQTRGALMMLSDAKITADGHSRAGHDAQMQTRCMVHAAAKAPAVMRRNLRARGRGTLRPGWDFRTFRRAGPAHGLAHYLVRHTGNVRERLVPPWWIFALAMILPAMVAIAYGSALQWWAGAVLFAIGAGAAIWLLWRTAPVIAVDESGALLVAGARLPREAQGPLRTVTLDDVDELLRGDARAFTALRPWYSRDALVIDVVDSNDPHTRWIFSVRDSKGFALALKPE